MGDATIEWATPVQCADVSSSGECPRCRLQRYCAELLHRAPVNTEEKGSRGYAAQGLKRSFSFARRSSNLGADTRQTT